MYGVVFTPPGHPSQSVFTVLSVMGSKGDGVVDYHVRRRRFTSMSFFNVGGWEYGNTQCSVAFGYRRPPIFFVNFTSWPLRVATGEVDTTRHLGMDWYILHVMSPSPRVCSETGKVYVESRIRGVRSIRALAARQATLNKRHL